VIDTTTTKTNYKLPESVTRVWLTRILAGMMSGHCRIHAELVWSRVSPFLGGKGFISHLCNILGRFGGDRCRKLLQHEDI
jgi:hypothetical protein